jgi:hypothetical protein
MSLPSWLGRGPLGSQDFRLDVVYYNKSTRLVPRNHFFTASAMQFFFWNLSSSSGYGRLPRPGAASPAKQRAPGEHRRGLRTLTALTEAEGASGVRFGRCRADSPRACCGVLMRRCGESGASQRALSVKSGEAPARAAGDQAGARCALNTGGSCP